MTEILVKKESDLSKSLKIAFSQIYDEFEDHLHAINENTSEVQENYTYVCELDNKISKLNERLDEIHNILEKFTGKKTLKKARFEDIDPLTATEKNVFMNLYTESKPISFSELAKKMKISIILARQYITNLLEKGVPIKKTYHKTIPKVSLDSRFKNLQAKKNILKIEQRILV